MPPLQERAAVRRLYDRFGWGARGVDVDDGVRQGFDACLGTLLAGAGDDPGAAATPPPDVGMGEEPESGTDARTAYDEQRGDHQRAMALWWLDRMSAVRAPTRERVTWFWHGHFATSQEKVNRPAMMLRQNATLRERAMGSFADLTRAMIADPALVMWLDGQTNRKGLPNENLGRELLELFALGVGHYGESDVKESARALTGWTLDPEKVATAFDPKKHDAGVKTVLGSRAAFDADSLVDLVTAADQSARFVATRVWQRHVAAEPPPPVELDRLVAAYGPQRDVSALIRAAATSPTFRDGGSSLVKQPVEWATGLARALGVRVADLEEKEGKSLLDRLQKLGQVPFRPPNVGGWPAGAVWLTPTATVHRLAVAKLLLGRAKHDGVPSGSKARLEWARARLGVDGWSDRTRAALDGVAADGPTALLTVAAVSPEYVVSG